MTDPPYANARACCRSAASDVYKRQRSSGAITSSHAVSTTASCARTEYAEAGAGLIRLRAASISSRGAQRTKPRLPTLQYTSEVETELGLRARSRYPNRQARTAAGAAEEWLGKSRQQRFESARHVREARVRQQVALEVHFLTVQVVVPTQPHGGTGHGKRELRKRERTPRQAETSAKVGDNALVLGALVAFLATAAPAERGNAPLHVEVRKPGLRQLKRAVELQPVDDILRPRGQHHSCRQVHAADEGRLCRLHGQLHQVFEPGSVEPDVEINVTSRDLLGPDNRAGGRDGRVVQLRIDSFENRVAVGAVDNRLEARVEGHLLSGQVKREVRGFGGAIDFNALQHTVIRASGRQGATKALDH